MRYEDIKPGMRLRIVRRCESHSNGWDNAWIDEMTERLGQVATVSRISREGVWFKEVPCGWPWEALELEDPNWMDPLDLVRPLTDMSLTGPSERDAQWLRWTEINESWYRFHLDPAAISAQRMWNNEVTERRAELEERYAKYKRRIADMRSQIKVQMLDPRQEWRHIRLSSFGWSRAQIISRMRADHHNGRDFAKAWATYRKSPDNEKLFVVRGLFEKRVMLNLYSTDAARRIPQKVAELFSAYQRAVDRLDCDWGRPPWFEEDWYQNSPHFYRFCHISTEDPTQVAYTENVDKLVRNVQTRCKPGRFLQKFFSDVLTPEEIRKWAERVVANADATSTLRFVENTDPDGWEKVYEHGHGFNSCMVYNRSDRYLDSMCHGQFHPARVYARKGNGLRLAYIGTALDDPDMKVYARAIVRDDGEYRGYIRIYGDSRIETYLSAAGYGDRVSLDGVELNKTHLECNYYVMPYLDSCCNVRDEDDYFVVDRRGGIDAQNSSGLIELESRYRCPRCGAEHDDEDDLHYSGYEGESYCTNCEDDFVCAVVNVEYYGRNYDMVLEEHAVEFNGTWYLDDAELLSECGLAQCAECGEWELVDEMTSTSRGVVCGCIELVELATEDEYGSSYAHPEDVKPAVTRDGRVVMIHEDTEYDDEFQSPEEVKGQVLPYIARATEPDVHQHPLPLAPLIAA